MSFPTNQIMPPTPPPGPPQQPPSAGKGCSPGCKTVMIGCGGMILGCFFTIGVELALIAKGVSQVTDFFNQQGSSRPTSPVDVESGDPADLNLKGMRDLELSRKCGTSEEQTDPEVARVCRQLREDSEMQKRNERREKEEHDAERRLNE